MNKKNILLFFATLIIGMFTLFQIKYHVQNLKKDLVEINRQIAYNKEAIHVLKAEWAYLSSPKRIKELSQKYLNLSYSKANQIHQIKNISVAQLENRKTIKRAENIKPMLKPTLSSTSLTVKNR